VLTNPAPSPPSHTCAQDNYPEMRSIMSDLSPFYLSKAREAIREWKNIRMPEK